MKSKATHIKKILTTSLQATLLVVFFALSGCASSTLTLENGRAIKIISYGQRQLDKKLESSIKSTLEVHDSIFSNNVFISVFNGTVLAIGSVPDKQMIKQVEQIIKSAATKSYYNEVTIGEPETLPEQASGLLIQAHIKTSLIVNKIDASIVRITMFKNIAFMQGFVSENQRQFILDLASRVDGVVKVIDLFEVIDPNKQKELLSPVKELPDDIEENEKLNEEGIEPSEEIDKASDTEEVNKSDIEEVNKSDIDKSNSGEDTSIQK